MGENSFNRMRSNQRKNRLNALFRSGKDVKFYPNRGNKISLMAQPGHSNPRNYLPRNRKSLGRTHKNNKNNKNSKNRKKSKTEKTRKSSNRRK